MDDETSPEPPHVVADGDELRQRETQDDDPDLRELLSRLTDRSADVARELAELRTQTAREHDRAAAREQVINRLHEENERMRAGERQLLLRPVLTDLQRLRHEMLRDSGRLPAHFDAAQAAGLLRSYAHNLELTLERGGVQVVSPQAGAPFDASSQRVTGVVDTGDQLQDTTVAEVVLDGYRDVVADRTVLPAAVLVHRWAPSHAETS